jgi:hypothetical protein
VQDEDVHDPVDTRPRFDCPGDAPGRATLRQLWSDLDARYAVFDLRLPADTTWDDAGNVACAALASATGPEDVFAHLIAMLQTLDDGHTQLHARDLSLRADAWVSVYPHYDALYTAELAVEAHYLDAPLRWAADDWVAWGRMGDVGYVSLTSMDALSPSGNEGADVRAAKGAIARVRADLDDARAWVVDVRANEGGWDAVSLAIAAEIAGPRTLAWSETRRDGPAHDDFGDWVDVHTEANDDGYPGPVVLLTSGGTFSAAETFVLAMRERPGVTVLGETTSGHLSDLVSGRLDNGWRYDFSGERYRAADGELYEGVGIPPDVAEPFDPDALRAGTDTQLEAALRFLGP